MSNSGKEKYGLRLSEHHDGSIASRLFQVNGWLGFTHLGS
jgi:hypothetical protein